ncbi:uncharacterized protein FIBRA_04471 [Fibroporia radiculosa]|uniref:Protein kinase domain-containing protein n=1 Tax=Fibroporia radiculosa TaxID=599839 RepID=J4IA66_9APHY|nr:uncharacterized protein FIBRA_04471 [Fibroporia radiculosa]CCM02376.1 predicted protein [Fibroporia radiculosa]
MRQHLEHITFMHNYNIAHLDISLHNILTDDESRYACIDFETSRRFSGIGTPRIRAPRAAELPPEVEEGGWSDPYKIDIWASGMLILRAAKVGSRFLNIHNESSPFKQMTGNDFPELSSVVSPMLRDAYEQRPTAKEALASFDAMVCTIRKDRLDSYGSCQ